MSQQLLASRIDHVTVYREGALVRRVAELSRASGYPTTIAIGPLPLAMDDGSIRVRTEATRPGGPPPRAVDIRVGLTAPPPTDIGATHDGAEIERLLRAEQRLEEAIATTRASIERLGSIELPARPASDAHAPAPATPADGRLELISLLDERSRTLLDHQDRLQRELRDVRERRLRLEAERDRARSKGPATADELRKSILIGLAEPGGAAPQTRIEVEYQVPGACWAPAYALRVDASLDRARIQMRALVRQDTGEDWSGVQLLLSTAVPQAWTEAPELPTLRIGRRQPPPKRGWREPPEGAEGLFSDHDAFRRRIETAARTEESLSLATEAEAGEGAAPDWTDDLFDDALEEAPVPTAAPPEVAMAAEPEAAELDEDLDGPPREARAAFMAAPRARKSKRSRRPSPPPPSSMPGRSEEADAGVPPPGDEPVAVGPDPDLLDYSRLRLPPADAPGRGVLRPARARELWAELLEPDSAALPGGASEGITRAIDRARSASRGAPPPGHRIARPVDGYDHAYAADARVDVPSGDRFRPVPVVERDAALSLSHVVVPRESCDVYRLADLVNPLEAPLLEGPVDVYLDDALLLTTPLRLVETGEAARIGLGVEESIKVARNARYSEESSGVLRGALELRHEIEVEIVSHRPAPSRIEVRERVPVPRAGEEKIKVAVEASPPWEAYEPPTEPGSADLRGGHRWVVSLEAGDRTMLSARYVVTIPARSEVVGGNRREGTA